MRFPSVSVVVPVYGGEATLAELHRRLREALEKECDDHEIIFVEDGGRDGSWSVIQAIVAGDPCAKGIRLSRNFGQHNALLCGIRAASHGIVVTLDDDLQHPPEEIPKLLAALTDDVDVVYGRPQSLPHSVQRNFVSRFSKIALSRVMGMPNVLHLSAFRAFRTDLRNAFATYHSPALLLDVLLSWGSTRFEAVPVRHDVRPVGESNYTFLRLVNQALIVLTGFSTAPLRLASLVGFAFTLFGLGVLIYVLGQYFFSGTLPGFAFLASLIALFGGAQLFAMGIIGEYLATIFHRSMDRPVYVERQRVGAFSDRRPGGSRGPSDDE
jgi:undecaprenyl-phosphate 4-deoxy-4-formamido-L-arabinose transferase